VRHAFTALLNEEGLYIIGRADEGVGGYTPQYRFGVYPSYDEAKARADEENARLGLSKEEATTIVLSTLFKRVPK
jgi:hypothetical protein